MRRRGGFNTRLGERVAWYQNKLEEEWHGAVMLHAISVGEVMLALKLMRAWRKRAPEQRFILGVGTATGHGVATGAGLDGMRVVYAPLDFRGMVRRYLERFKPERLVLVEGEVWPHLMMECRARGIPVTLVNARMSPRSARRYEKFAGWLRPIFSLLDGVAVQEREDAEIWRHLGVEAGRIHHTGSLKFDSASAVLPVPREEFQNMLDAFGTGKPVLLAASTHSREEELLVKAMFAASPRCLPVIVPRHAERRAELRAGLERCGWHVTLRSEFSSPVPQMEAGQVFVVDSTGELRDWTAHADGVIIGKSFRSVGGQNPAEAILADCPLIFGPHMENFEPLATRLVRAGGALRADDDGASLISTIQQALRPDHRELMTSSARKVLDEHCGAAERMLDLLLNGEKKH